MKLTEPRLAFLCEVVTHTQGLLTGQGKGYRDTVRSITGKFEAQRAYAKDVLRDFQTFRYMLWSPRVCPGLVEKLKNLSGKGLELVINEEYTHCINQLWEEAKELKHQVSNPAFRLLQILACVERARE
mgnify:CR=1 FL=1